MQQSNLSHIGDNETRFLYVTILGILLASCVLYFLWHPLNPNKTVYIPLTNQIQTTVVENNDLITAVGKASIKIITETKVDESAVSESLDQPKPEDDIVKDEIDEIIQEDNIVRYTVNKGDTLSEIMKGYGVNQSDIYLLSSQYKKLSNLKIGQQISWITDNEHNLTTFNWYLSSSTVFIYEREGGAYKERVETRIGTWKNVIISGEIKSNFVIDAKNTGLTSNEIAIITKALQWQLDFRRLQKNDQFSVLISREMFGDMHENSKLLAIRIQNASKDYYAVLADDGSYYDSAGGSLSQSFLRHPLEKAAKVSSPFNPRRLHPVTRKIAPHNGIDFAVTRGTPVLSVGDGEVVIAKYSGSAGNFIAIRHGRQYTTKYMHLDKIFVKPGQIIKKGDKIGLSGNTGRSTGPHLHYELHIDGKPVNPITANLPLSSGLTGKAKTKFLDKFETIKSQLIFNSELN